MLIGDKNYTEQFILGELYTLALSAQGFDTSLTQNIGPTSVSLQAMQDGTLDLYPEYLNVFDDDIAGYAKPFATLKGATSPGQDWAAAHGLVLLAPTPFSDTAGIGVSTAFAQQNGMRTLYGLRRVANTLTIGAPLEFQTSAGGLPALSGPTGSCPRASAGHDRRSIQELAPARVQAAYVTTTDAQLSLTRTRCSPTRATCSGSATSSRSCRPGVTPSRGTRVCRDGRRGRCVARARA